MKDVKILSYKAEKFSKSDIRMAVIYHLLFAALGFTVCKAAFFEKYMPLGVSFLAGCSPAYLPSAAVGVFIGYFIPGISVSGFRYIAASLAVIAVRFIISFSKKLNTSPLFAALTSSVSVAVTSAVAFSGTSADVIHITLEVLLVAAAAIVISRTFSFLPHLYRGLSNEELGCFLIVISMVTVSLYRVALFGVSISGILTAALILTCAKYGGMQASTACSVSSALLLYFSGRPAQICLIFTAAALISGLVTSLGKYIQICSLFTCVTVSVLLLPANAQTAAFVTEVLIGCIIFALIPKSTGINLGRVFTCFPEISVNNDLNRAVTIRLSEAAASIKDVKTTVDEVASRLDGINTPGFSGMLAQIKDSACIGCKMHTRCWQANKSETLGAIFEMINKIKSTGHLSSDNMPGDFKSICLRPERFCGSLSTNYLSYAAITETNGRIQQIRQAIGDQFEGIAIMLAEMSQNFSKDIRFDNAAAVTAVCALKNLGIIAEECSAPVDKYGRMKIIIKLKKPNDAVLNKRDIMRALSLSCERNFAPPVIKKASGETFINISERAKFKMDIGISQKSARPGDMCGDAYSYFSDGTGRFIIILSDGMGTGSRAAVDSAMASGLISRLIKSGFGFDCALKILNSSMLFKSADESLATLDIACFDMFNGELNLYKAGAAPTVVRRSGRSGKAVSTSMPIGILPDVAFDKAYIKLSSKDILVMVSDGVTATGTDWIRDELEHAVDCTAQSLSDRLCQMAANRRTDSHTDDITVITAIIN
ncbi:MAG: SpoIIE family protein phosphatase [Clostridia bacterium]|nr:SpoIIE family protein phosphatase [Clostridia bacterium]